MESAIKTGNQRFSNLVCIVFLTALCMFFCFNAIIAPYFESGDLVSNTLPILHYKKSIIENHSFPSYTNLWYGGREQSKNPLWNFWYFPSTLFWLILPFAWAARIVIVGHFIASALIARNLAKQFIKSSLAQCSVALLLISPVVVRLYLGHLEKILAWPWILLGLRFAIVKSSSSFRDGIIVGFSLGMVGLAGENYYVFYSSILLLAVSISRLDWKYIIGGALTSIPIMVLHSNSVLYIVGKSREFIGYNLHPLQFFQPLFINLPSGPSHFESFSIIGSTTFFLILFSFLLAFKNRKTMPKEFKIFIALLIVSIFYALLSMKIMYKFTHVFDTFRVTSRAMAFLATALVCVLLIYWTEFEKMFNKKKYIPTILIALSAIHCVIIWWQVRPNGAEIWISNKSVIEITNSLIGKNAKSVWISDGEVSRIIGVSLNENNIALPNWYFGTMGQKVSTSGNKCGYSFDHLISNRIISPAEEYPLKQGIWPYDTIGYIKGSLLSEVGKQCIKSETYRIYELNCVN